MQEQALCPPDGPAPYTGRVTFACTIGKLTLEVEGRVSDDELIPASIAALFQGVDVAPIFMHFDECASVIDYFDANRSDILAFDKE